MQRKTEILCVFLLAALSGCRETLPDVPPPEHKDVHLRIACPPGVDELVREQTNAWRARQQATVETVIYQPPAAPPAADLWVIAPARLPHFIDAGEVRVFPQSLQQRGSALEWSTLLPIYRDGLLLWRRSAYAAPLVGEAPVLLYRADLLAAPEHRTGYLAFQRQRNADLAKLGKPAGPVRELRPPAGWEELAVQAEYFRQHRHPGKATPSLEALPVAVEQLDRLFYTVAAGYARRAVRSDEDRGPKHVEEVFTFHCDTETGAARISTPGFVAALRLLQRLQACRPPKAAEQPEADFLAGRAVFCLTEAGTAAKTREMPELRGNVGVVVVPGTERYFNTEGAEVALVDVVNRVPYLGGAGWLLGVHRTAERPEAAFDLLAELAGPARGMQMALSPRWGGPTRPDQALRDRWAGFGLQKEKTLALRDAVSRGVYLYGIKNPVSCLRTPDEADFRSALEPLVRKALDDGGDAAIILGEAQTRWAELIQKRGREKHLAEYRASLGL